MRQRAYRRTTSTTARLALQSVPFAMMDDSLTFLPTQLSPAGVFTGAAGLQFSRSTWVEQTFRSAETTSH
jgi:hypothetical protein